MLVDVEPAFFDVLLDADTPELVQDAQRGEARCEDECPDRDKAERLDSELMERAGVHETARTRPEVLREERDREQPGRERAPDAGEAVHRDRPDRVVDPDSLDEDDAEDSDEPRTDAD